MEGCVPDAFKSAVVTPLIKKPNLPSNDLKNYHPVSGLSFISKLVERVVAKQLLEHIHVHNLDNPYQSAYKAGHSTETALFYIKNEVHLSLSRGETTALVLLDLSAAFDTIDHSNLLSCLQNWFGVGGCVLKWFTSYLTDCYQSIKIGSTLSDVCKLLFSVPQGSVLGPLLFSLYTTPLNSIIRRHKGIKFHFYADDSQVYIHLSQKNASAAFEKLNRCLDDVKEWMSTSKLKLNPDKTEFIIFGSKRQRDKLKACFPINIFGNSVCPADSVKIWECGLIQTFLYPSMFRMSAKVVLLNSVTSDMSGGFSLMMFLCLWLMLWLVVGWITATHFSGASPSSIYANYSASKIVQLELYQTPVDTPV